MRLAMLQAVDGRRILAAADRQGKFHDLLPVWREAIEQHYIPAGIPATLDSLVQLEKRELLIQLIETSIDSIPAMEAHEYTWDIPIQAGDLICVGRNYAAHAAELGNPIPSEPILFMKPRTCLFPSDHTLALPHDSIRVELEGELALIIGKDLFGEVNKEEALSAIWGVTLINDITDRGKQSQLKEKGKPWLAGKGRPGFAPLGPAVYVLKDSAEIASFTFTTTVNGESKQTGDVQLWLWPPAELVSAVAGITGLRKGDILATGTPAGVCEIRSGDRIEITNEKIGSLITSIQ